MKKTGVKTKIGYFFIMLLLMTLSISNKAWAYEEKSIATAPNAPVFSQGTSTVMQEALEVTIRKNGGNEKDFILYTLDGTTPAYKDGMAQGTSVMAGAEAKVLIAGKSSITLKAVCVNEAGLVSKLTSATYTLKPYVKEIGLQGLQKLVKGKSFTFITSIQPAYASNKKLSWNIEPAGQGVTVSGGKVTATAKAQAGTYTVYVTAQDQTENPAMTGYQFEVIGAAEVKALAFTEKKVNIIRTNGNAKYEAYKTLKLTQTSGEIIAGDKKIASYCDWSSSNQKVATVSADGVVTCHAPGKVKITAKASDSSGVSAACDINITQSVTGIKIEGSKVTASGKSNTYKAVVTPANATKKTVTWSVEPTGQGVTITSTGMVKVAKDTALDECIICAKSTDDSSVMGTFVIKINKTAVTQIKLQEEDGKPAQKLTKTLFRVAPSPDIQTQMRVSVVYKDGTVPENIPYEFTSTKPGIVTVDQKGLIRVTGRGTGEAVIKCTLKDGSKQSDGNPIQATVVVKVINPASSLTLSLPKVRSEYVAKGKTLQLTANFGTDYGILSNKTLKWTTSDMQRATVNSKGLVTMKADSNNPVVITATMTDGSNISKSILLYGSTPVKNISMGEISYQYANTNYTFEIKKSQGKQALELCFNDPWKEMNTCPYVAVTSSAPEVLYVEQEGRNIILEPREVSGSKKVKITLKTLDGTGKSHTWYFMVVD